MRARSGRGAAITTELWATSPRRAGQRRSAGAAQHRDRTDRTGLTEELDRTRNTAVSQTHGGDAVADRSAGWPRTTSKSRFGGSVRVPVPDDGDVAGEVQGPEDPWQSGDALHPSPGGIDAQQPPTARVRHNETVSVPARLAGDGQAVGHHLSSHVHDHATVADVGLRVFALPLRGDIDTYAARPSRTATPVSSQRLSGRRASSPGGAQMGRMEKRSSRAAKQLKSPDATTSPPCVMARSLIPRWPVVWAAWGRSVCTPPSVSPVVAMASTKVQTCHPPATQSRPSCQASAVTSSRRTSEAVTDPLPSAVKSHSWLPAQRRRWRRGRP